MTPRQISWLGTAIISTLLIFLALIKHWLFS